MSLETNQWIIKFLKEAGHSRLDLETVNKLMQTNVRNCKFQMTFHSVQIVFKLEVSCNLKSDCKSSMKENFSKNSVKSTAHNLVVRSLIRKLKEVFYCEVL